METNLWIFQIFCLLLISYTEIAQGANQTSDALKISTPLGQIQGTTFKTARGAVIYAFRGIRYALAPTGSLRFKPPVAVKEWTGIYNASNDPPACPQPNVDNISEDCLFLNVYTTKLKIMPKIKKTPVIVFFHPGNFYEGSCNSSVYGPHYLLDKHVVLVVPNYRLGALGFLSTGTKEAPGNNGLKDQVAALRWIQNNIASFNGDPNSVTIVGGSAGGMSVTAHLTSPLSKGLFHKAIAMSGSIFGSLPILNNQLNLAKKQAQFLNCPYTNPQVILSCLTNKSAEDIANSVRKFEEFLDAPMLIWTPVIEPDFGQERFLTEHPINSLERGKFNKVPVVLGVTIDEFGSKSFDIMDNGTVLEGFDKNYLKVWPIIFGYERNSSRSTYISKGLRKFYFPCCIDNSLRQSVADLYADSLVGFSVNRGAKLLAKYNSKNTFYYLFGFHGRYSYAYYPHTNDTLPYGVSNKDDLLYLFYNSEKTPLFNSDPEDKIVDKITQLWSNFANTGNPTPEPTEADFLYLGSLKWPAFELKSQYFMEINAKLMVSRKLFDFRYQTWDKLIPLSNYKPKKSHKSRNHH